MDKPIGTSWIPRASLRRADWCHLPPVETGFIGRLSLDDACCHWKLPRCHDRYDLALHITRREAPVTDRIVSSTLIACDSWAFAFCWLWLCVVGLYQVSDWRSIGGGLLQHVWHLSASPDVPPALSRACASSHQLGTTSAAKRSPH